MCATRWRPARRKARTHTATLPQVSVNALYDSGLFRLKLPQVLGGAEADLVTQLDVLEAVCRIDPSAGWCLMIGAASLGGLGAFLPEETIDEIFVDGNPPRTAGVFAPFGAAVPVDSGYRLTGRWSFASGVRHSEWISAGARVVTEKAGYPSQIRVVISTSDVKIHDNWQVMGLRGTGSCDFSAEDLFVPDRFAWDVSLTEPLRGGAMYRLGRPGFVTNEHSAFALGVGRRALDAVTDVAASKSRGYNSANLLVRRPAFPRDQWGRVDCDPRRRDLDGLGVVEYGPTHRRPHHRGGRQPPHHGGESSDQSALPSEREGLGRHPRREEQQRQRDVDGLSLQRRIHPQRLGASINSRSVDPINNIQTEYSHSSNSYTLDDDWDQESCFLPYKSHGKCWVSYETLGWLSWPVDADAERTITIYHYPQYHWFTYQCGHKTFDTPTYQVY